MRRQDGAALAAIRRFFERGKDTESGGVEPLAIEDLTAFEGAETALMTATLRYASAPRPGVRASFLLERATGSAAGWRIRHIHCSFDPKEA